MLESKNSRDGSAELNVGNYEEIVRKSFLKQKAQIQSYADKLKRKPTGLALRALSPQAQTANAPQQRQIYTSQ